MVTVAKLAILDTLGCAFGTYSEDPGRAEIINELYEKFKRLATPAIGAERAIQIVEMTEDLESIKNIRTFSRLFA